MINVCFICHANVCRSPLAEFLLKDHVKKLGLEDQFNIISRATAPIAIGMDTHPEFRKLMSEHEVQYEHREAAMITEDIVDNYQYVIYMDLRNFMNLKKLFPNKEITNAYCLSDFTAYKGQDIEDPFFTGRYYQAYQTILNGVKSFIKQLVIDAVI